jgi:hypothetical protein
LRPAGISPTRRQEAPSSIGGSSSGEPQTGWPLLGIRLFTLQGLKGHSRLELRLVLLSFRHR